MIQLLMTRKSPSSFAGTLARAFARMSEVVAEIRGPVAQQATQPAEDPADVFTAEDMPAVDDIEAAAREYNRAADQARRADRGKRAARKILDRLPAGTYGSWLVERIESNRQTADLDAIRAIFKANGLGPVPMKTSAPSLKLKHVPVTDDCTRCDRTWDLSDLRADGNGDHVCTDCHSSDTSAEDHHAARSYFAGV